MFQVKDTRSKFITVSLSSSLSSALLSLSLENFPLFSSVSFVDFEHVFVCWVGTKIKQ